MKKMTAEERRRAFQARTNRSKKAPSAPRSAASTRSSRSRSGLWSVVGIGLIAMSFIAASRVPSISFDVSLLRTVSFVEWLLPRLP
jgi:hypothetical protein